MTIFFLGNKLTILFSNKIFYCIYEGYFSHDETEIYPEKMVGQHYNSYLFTHSFRVFIFPSLMQ